MKFKLLNSIATKLFLYIQVLSLILVIPNLTFGQSDHYGFAKIPLTRSYNTTDYEGGIQNWDFSQDQRGYLYVANNFGLLEYDGDSWRKYTVENNTRLRSVFADTDGRIYVGGQNQFGYFESDSIGLLQFVSLYDRLPENEKDLEDVWRIIKHENQIFFSSYLGTVSYDGENLKRLEGDVNYGIIFTVATNIYAQSHDNALLELKNLKPQVAIPSMGNLKNEIRGIIPLNNNSLLVFQKEGEIYRVQNQNLISWFPEITNFLRKALVNEVLLLQNKNIAIGTQNNGVLIISQEGNLLKHITKDKGLDNRTVLALHEDSFQNLWVGLNNGITKIELSSPFSVIDEQSGLPGTGYCAALYNDQLYLGTSNGLFHQNAQQNPISANSEYHMIENSGGQVYNIQNVDDKLLLAHHDGGFVVENMKATQIYDGHGVWKYQKIPSSDKILAGTYRGFLTFEKGVQNTLVKEVSGFEESSRVFEFINDTTLFMTHGYKGIFKIGFNSSYDQITEINFYGQEKGLPSNILINVFNLGGDHLYFAAEEGIYTYNPTKDRLEVDKDLTAYLGESTHLTVMKNDLMGNIYFISNQEIGYLELTRKADYIKHTNLFSKIRKYLSDDLENISIIDHENVLFGAKEGFIHYNPSLPYPQNQPFKANIRSINATTDKDLIVYGGNGNLDKVSLNLPAFFTSLQFQFASPYFNNEDQLRYQFQLENFDNEWSEWTRNTQKEYTNLSEGTYTFHVRALNSFDEISEEETFKFTVFPPWYRSKIAYGLYGLIFFTVFGAYMYILDRRFRKEKKSLNIQQQRELIRKDNEIVKVSKNSEELITRLKNDKLRSEIDHKNRELATTTMHLINKNEFMLTIREALKESAKTGSKDQFKKMIRDIDRNLSEDEGWEQFTKHFDQVHGEFLSNIKRDNPTLTPQEIKLCAYLRMNMSSKEIANLLNISVRGVEIGRYRLRKKLGISRETNLFDYMLEYS